MLGHIANARIAIKIFIAPLLLVACILVLGIVFHLAIGRQGDALERMASVSFAHSRATAELDGEASGIQSNVYRLLGWQSAIVLNSSGTTNFSATASGLTAQSGALWIGNYTITNNSGNLTFTGEGGSNYQTRGIYNNGNNNTLVNNSTGDITFNGNHSGYNASPWSAFEMYNTNATNNSSGNININGSN